MNATKTLLEVEADVKEKFGRTKGLKRKSSERTLIEDKYRGPPIIDNINIKFAKDQVRR